MSTSSNADPRQPLRPDSRSYRPGPRAVTTVFEGLFAVLLAIVLITGVVAGLAYLLTHLGGSLLP